MRPLAFLALLALAACGADGVPRKPAPKPGVTISGEAAVGVVIK
jgi:hypothetical protein